MENILPPTKPTCMCTKLFVAALLFYAVKSIYSKSNYYIDNTDDMTDTVDIEEEEEEYTQEEEKEYTQEEEEDWDKMDIQEFAHTFIASLQT